MSDTVRLKLTIAYDGTPFRGWQSQAEGNTVQDHLEASFRELCGKRVAVHGAGRTDAGVHALAQCAHADVPAGRLTIPAWRDALNAHLPREIRVLRTARVSSRFHTRFNARGKVYAYRIWNGRVHPPFEINRSWHVPGPLNPESMRKAAELLTGRHDFAGFAANRGKPEENTVRTIASIRIRREGDLWTLRFEGDGFLYRMVRLLTGSMVRCALGRADLDWLRSVLDAGRGGKTSFAAPACGLTLVRVIY